MRLPIGSRSGGQHRLDSREVDRCVVDAVEDVSEHDHCDREADLDQLHVGVTGGPDRIEFVTADRAAAALKAADEARQGVTLRVAWPSRRPGWKCERSCLSLQLLVADGSRLRGRR